MSSELLSSEGSMPEAQIRKEVTLSEVLAHISANTVDADPSRVICVDGGYRPTENHGALARPGGHMGYSEVLLKLKQDHPELGLTPEKAFDLVNEFAQSRGEKYGWHSDQHADPQESEDHEHHSADKPILGCGHCARAASRAELYGVDGNDIKALIAYARQENAAHPTDLVVLNREHSERAVLVITGTEKTVNAWDVDGTGDEYFIYDATRDQAYMAALVKYLNEHGYPITVKEFVTAAKTQTDATLGLLAGGLRIYTVNVDGEQPIVNPGDSIPKIE